MTTRSERFRTRVRLERQALKLVNSQWNGAKLMGLSRDSIGAWLTHNLPHTSAQRISQVLVAIAIKLRIEADSSRIVFDESALEASLQSEFEELDGLLAGTKC